MVLASITRGTLSRPRLDFALNPCGARGDAIRHKSDETLLPSRGFAEAISCVADFQVSAARLIRGLWQREKGVGWGEGGKVKVRLGMGLKEGRKEVSELAVPEYSIRRESMRRANLVPPTGRPIFIPAYYQD